jgi:hypothetical protein
MSSAAAPELPGPPCFHVCLLLRATTPIVAGAADPAGPLRRSPRPGLAGSGLAQRCPGQHTRRGSLTWVSYVLNR